MGNFRKIGIKVNTVDKFESEVCWHGGLVVRREHSYVLADSSFNVSSMVCVRSHYDPTNVIKNSQSDDC